MSERPSALKLAANRKNAQKSTGPKTPEGKQRCAHNAMRHGLWSKDVVVRSGRRPERRADFEAMVAELREGFAPRDPVEEALVQRIASCLWRLRRAHRYETAAIHTAIQVQTSPEFAAPGRPIDLRRAQQHDEQIDAIKKRLHKLRGDLAIKGRLLAMLRHPDTTQVKYLDQMDHLRFAHAIKEAAGQCDPPVLELTDPAALAKAIELASDEVDSLRLEVARCETLLRDAIDWQCDAVGVEFEEVADADPPPPLPREDQGGFDAEPGNNAPGDNDRPQHANSTMGTAPDSGAPDREMVACAQTVAQPGETECCDETREGEAPAEPADGNGAPDHRREMAAALPSERKLWRIIRYESMLDRELHRALGELRRRRAADDQNSRGSALDRTGRRDQARPSPDVSRQSDHAHPSVGMPPDWQGEAPTEIVGDSARRSTARAKRADFRVSPDAFCPVSPPLSPSGLRKGEWDAL